MKVYIGIVKCDKYPGKGAIVACYESHSSLHYICCCNNDECGFLTAIPKDEVEIIGEI